MSVQNFSVLACLEIPEKFVVVVGGGAGAVKILSRTSLGFSFNQAEQNSITADTIFKRDTFCTKKMNQLKSLIFKVKI